MGLYQRCLSKLLIFFSVLLVFFFLFIESNIGFKFIFNLSNRVLFGLKIEEISGNWRNFTLKHVNYDIFGISFHAESIHLVLDLKSLFNKPIVFKKVETKNLAISLKENIAHLKVKNTFSGIEKNNMFTKQPIFFENIHIDKVFFTTPRMNVFLTKIRSGVQFIDNNITISPSYIDDISIVLLNFNFKKKNILKAFNTIEKNNYSQKIYSVLDTFKNKPNISIPFNINLKYLKCNRINFLNYKKYNIFQMELRTKLQNNIFKIQKIQVSSSFLKIKSSGKIFFNNNSVLCSIKNELLVPKLNNRNIKFSFNLNLNNKLKFNFYSSNLYNINLEGVIFLDYLDYPFYIKLRSKNLVSLMKKNLIFKWNSFNFTASGKINDYSLSCKNIFSISGISSIFFDIHARGNLENVLLKKITFVPIELKSINKKKNNLKNNIISKNSKIYSKYILELIGKICLEGKSNNNRYNLSFPKVNLNARIMKKKISILGSLYYENLDLVKIPGINLFAGNNNLFIKGSLGNGYNNLDYILHADDLSYFLPNLTGKIRVKAKVRNNYKDPFIKSKILVNAKKIDFANFYIDFLHIKFYWNNNKQKFYFLFKNRDAYINFTLNSYFNNNTKNWNGFLSNVNIKNFWWKINDKNVSVVYNTNFNNKNFHKKNTKTRVLFSSFLHNSKIYLSKFFNQNFIDFKTTLSIHAKLKSTLEKNAINGKIFLNTSNIKIKKKIIETTSLKNIDDLKVSISIDKDIIKSEWTSTKLGISLSNKNVIGYLNILDIYRKKKIDGKFFVSHLPVSLINVFTVNFQEIQGFFDSNIRIFGTLDQPKISADLNLQDVFIRSDNILKYIVLFFPHILEKIENIRINQKIIIQKSSILLTLNLFFNNSDEHEWNILFKSKKIELVVFPKIKVQFSSELNLHYFLSRYDLVGYIIFPFFQLNINEKNFIF